MTWDPKSTGRTVFRTSYGVYYDQALVGIFEQNSFTNPPFVNTVSILNPKLSNPGSGTTPPTTGVLALIGNGDDFKTPRTQEWNAGVQQQLYARGALDVSYVGAHGDHLIRPIDINYPNPADVLRLGSVNLARPYQGYGAITLRKTTARSNYWGILSSFRHNGGAAGSLTLNYTLSRNRTDATNDRDAIDIPQDPNNLAIEYADARTDRRHIFTANYVYEIPFLKDSPNSLLKAMLGGWQIAGITSINSGQPVPRISESTNGFLRGGRPNIVGDPAPAIRPATCTGSTRTPTRRRPTAPTATRSAPNSGSRAATRPTCRCRRTGRSTARSASSSAPTPSTRSTTRSGSPTRARTGSTTPARPA